jgi:hypothetical protein
MGNTQVKEVIFQPEYVADYVAGDIVRYDRNRPIPKKVQNFCQSPHHKVGIVINHNQKWCKQCRATYKHDTSSKKEIGIIRSIDLVERGIYKGYCVSLEDGREVSLLIDDTPNCCEEWDWQIEQPPNVIGATLYKAGYSQCKNRDFAAVKLNTSGGCIKLLVYCEHNGYYPHTFKSNILGCIDEQEL